ncbi:NAD(P)/FAD-dependent oxidoreductase [Caldisericum exile]|uniref:FAD dependent oxidoreductase n=1 Tax=Caldisericum exile (strain DSM 21853 / NBRC 104410 / AZM16c01) TaxID=511051 RepID=A0A7U6GFS0_CALEA|nr:NAD(P)/FAD-dependent oxidoreductase [Caldisericum exile]BAL81565.1 FAD dependent oxidoreductase [Caldisericum exile AZM16c01]
MEKFDVIVIGAGVVGAMIARTLSRYELNVAVIEKESDVCMGTTAANTAIIHAGYDPLPGTLKAELNVRGNKLWDQLAFELGIPFKRTGDYVVAIDSNEFNKLEELYNRGKLNGVIGLEILGRDEVLSRLPYINKDVGGAMFASTGGIIDPFQAALAPMENAVVNGVKLFLETSFEDFIFDGKRIVGIKTNKGDFLCSWVINAAGLYADTVMHKANLHPEFKITPRKGEYYIFDRNEFAISEVLFPVPTEISKGIMVTTTVHGNTIIGPNSHEVPDKEDTSNTVEGLDEVFKGASKLVPQIANSMKHVIAIFAGLRATGNARTPNPNIDYHHDFLIEVNKDIGLVNVAGIESPGLASSPAIAERVIELLKDSGLKLKEKKDFNPIRSPRPRFKDMSNEERAKLVSKNPSYGRIICRCEYVTEGEILDEIHAPVPARTYDAIKRRTWLGTGRCQGAFDTPRVVEILSKELGISPLEVTKKGDDSYFLLRKTKEV